MNLRIFYQTEYRHPEEVSFSPHLFRLFPRPSTDCAVHESIAYERREEGTARTPEETLSLAAAHAGTLPLSLPHY